MNLAERIEALTDSEHIESLTAAIEAYSKDYPGVDLMMLTVSEGDIQTSSLINSEWQKPWLTRSDFVRDRCIYDPETNQWLEYYLDEMAKANVIPSVLIYCLEGRRPILIDGVHRTSAYLHADRSLIPAWLLRQS